MRNFFTRNFIETFPMRNAWPILIFLFNAFFAVAQTPAESRQGNRPQSPVPPFPYPSDDLEYDNAALGIHYSGTITYPNTGGPFPAALLITGSGQQDRDEALFGHRPFAVIADCLTRRGYAVLRVDDRQVGKSTGEKSRKHPVYDPGNSRAESSVSALQNLQGGRIW